MVKVVCQNIKYYVFLHNYFPTILVGSFLVAQTVKNMPVMREPKINPKFKPNFQSLGRFPGVGNGYPG